jgi:hypothetical protein
LLIILLPMKPAMRPSTIHAMKDMIVPPAELVRSTGS